jgi:hypothetical protein
MVPVPLAHGVGAVVGLVVGLCQWRSTVSREDRAG